MKRLERQLCLVVRQQMRGQACAIPEAGRDLARAFGQLSEARSWHAHGPNPISFPEIEAWCRLMGVPLGPVHVGILRAMDRAWTDSFHDIARGTPEGVKTLPPVSGQPLSAALFDIATG